MLSNMETHKGIVTLKRYAEIILCYTQTLCIWYCFRPAESVSDLVAIRQVHCILLVTNDAFVRQTVYWLTHLENPTDDLCRNILYELLPLQ